MLNHSLTHAYSLSEFIYNAQTSKAQSIEFFVIIFGVIPLSFALYLTLKIYFTCIKNKNNENNEVKIESPEIRIDNINTI